MAINEKNSYTEYTVTTPTTDFAFGFEYVDGTANDVIHVTVDDKDAIEAGYTFRLKNPTTIEMTPAVPSGVVRIFRETDIDLARYKFSSGALFRAENVDADFQQVLHSQQEVRDGFVKLRGDVLPLVEGLEDALKIASEASSAASEAAEAAETAAANVTFKVNGVLDLTGLEGVTKLAGIQAYVHDPLRGGDFVYEPDLADVNNGVTVFNGWVRQVIGGVYKASWAGVTTASDNTAAYNALLSAVPEYSTIEFEPNGTYSGAFVSNKSLNLKGTNVTLQPSTTGDCLAFESTGTTVNVLETTLVRGTTVVTLVGAYTIPQGALLTLWAGDRRDASNPVNFETVRVLSSVVNSGNTSVTLERATAGYKSGTITATLYMNPIFRPTVTGIKVYDHLTGNFTRKFRFKGVFEPAVGEVSIERSLGHGISFEECYGVRTGTIYFKSPQGVGSGEGYGLVSWKSSYCHFGKIISDGMRHALDLSSTHHAYAEYVEDFDAKGTVAMLAHNGFGSNIHIVKVVGKTAITGVSGVNTSSQGYRKLENGSWVVDNAKRLLNPTYNITIGNVRMTAANNLTPESATRCVMLETELGHTCTIGTLTLLLENTQTPTTTASCNPLHISGQCDMVVVGSIHSNIAGLGMRITNEGTSTVLGNIHVGLLDVGLSHYGVFQRGYNSYIDNYIYDQINRGYALELTDVAGVPTPKGVTIKTLRQRNSITTLVVQAINNGVGALANGYINSDVLYSSSTVLVSSTIGINALDLARRGYQNAFVVISGGSAGTTPTVTIPALPAPAYYNGQRMTIANSTPNSTTATEVTIPAGSTSISNILIPSGKSVTLISVAGLWRLL